MVRGFIVVRKSNFGTSSGRIKIVVCL